MALTALKTARYKGVLKEIRKEYIYKINRYPQNLTEAYDLLEHHAAAIKTAEAERAARRWRKKAEGAEGETIQGAHFYQDFDDSKLIPGTDGKKHNVKCYNCNRMGHYDKILN